MIHRPTTTKDFMKCPMYWRLKQLWQPKPAQWTPHRLMGTAIHAGVHEFWLTGDVVKASQSAQEALGANFIEQPMWTHEGCAKLVSKGLGEALHAIPGHGMWAATEELVGSELDLGHCHPDLVTRLKSTKKLVVTDLKNSYVVKPQWVSKRLMSYETDWQFYHYAWAVQEKYGEPVECVRVHLVALTPKTTSWVYEVKLSQARLANWLRSARWAWQAMDRALEIELKEGLKLTDLHQNILSCELFGGCAYRTACHTLELDEKAFQAFYDRVEDPAETPPEADDY